MNFTAVIAGGTRMVDLTTKWEFDVLAENMDEKVYISCQTVKLRDFFILKIRLHVHFDHLLILFF